MSKCNPRIVGVGHGMTKEETSHEWRVADVAHFRSHEIFTFYCVWCRTIEKKTEHDQTS